MAQKKSASRTTKSTAQKKTAAKNTAPPAKKPIRREVGGAVCIALGLISFLGLFPFTDGAWVIDGLCYFVWRGLFSWGFWISWFCFFWEKLIKKETTYS